MVTVWRLPFLVYDLWRSLKEQHTVDLPPFLASLPFFPSAPITSRVDEATMADRRRKTAILARSVSPSRGQNCTLTHIMTMCRHAREQLALKDDPEALASAVQRAARGKRAAEFRVLKRRAGVCVIKNFMLLVLDLMQASAAARA